EAGLRSEGLQRSATRQRDDRTARGERLERGDSEVFLAGEDQRPRTTVQVGDVDMGHLPQPADVGRKPLPQQPAVLAVAGDPQHVTGPPERLHREVYPLVGRERAEPEEVAVLSLDARRPRAAPRASPWRGGLSGPGGVQAETGEVHRRVDD